MRGDNNATLSRDLSPSMVTDSKYDPIVEILLKTLHNIKFHSDVNVLHIHKYINTINIYQCNISNIIIFFSTNSVHLHIRAVIEK